MYWANKPHTDCIERLFKHYEHTTKLSRFYNEDFVEKWAKKVKSIANAEKEVAQLGFVNNSTLIYKPYFFN